VLSARPSAAVSVESLFDGIDFQISVARFAAAKRYNTTFKSRTNNEFLIVLPFFLLTPLSARFDSLCSGIFRQCIEAVQTFLEANNMHADDITKVF
jgi:hypothetical protein